MSRFLLHGACLALLASCKLVDHQAPQGEVTTYSVGVGVSVSERHETLTGRIEFPPDEKGGLCGPKIIPTSGEAFSTFWNARSRECIRYTRFHGSEEISPNLQAKLWAKVRARIKIDPHQTYSIEILKQTYIDTRFGPRRSSDDSELLRVSKNGLILIDASMCELHHVKMERVIMGIASAEDYPEVFYEIRRKSFPNDAIEYLGCDSGGRSPGWKCPVCEKKLDAWEKKHNQ